MLGELVGRWRVERRLLDRRSGIAGRFRGTATFERDGRWWEEGTLDLGGYHGPAHRELRIAGDAVQFADGRPFHPLDLTGGPVEHLCGEDTYTGAYRLVAPDRLEVSWRVAGPDKDQQIETVYRRT